MERSPPPGAASGGTHGGHPLRMQVSFALAFLLPVLGMSAVFGVYICLVWYVSTRSAAVAAVGDEKKRAAKGLTARDLEKLPKATAAAGEGAEECAVCLEEIEPGQTVRSLPACHHNFHLDCADQWLKKHSACPLCRAKPLIEPITTTTTTTSTTNIQNQIHTTPNINLDAENLC